MTITFFDGCDGVSIGGVSKDCCQAYISRPGSTVFSTSMRMTIRRTGQCAQGLIYSTRGFAAEVSWNTQTYIKQSSPASR